MRPRLIAAILCLILSIVAVSSSMAQETTPEATIEITVEATIEVTPEATQTVTTAPESTTTPAATASAQTYTVRTGETLFRIARQFGLTTAELAAANGITNLNLIFAGQVLNIPAKGTIPATPSATPTAVVPTAAPVTATPAPGAQTYTVASGDTLFRIAVRFGTNVNALVQANNIDNPNRIVTGQRLTIPAAGNTPVSTPAPAATTAAVTLPDNEYGRGIEVFIEGQDVNALATQIVQLGVSWVKITVNWRELEATEGASDFTQLDAAVNAFSNAGLKVMLTLTGAPDWTRPSASTFVKQATDYGPPDNVSDFGTFAAGIAERYEGRVQAYEIWSQPNLRRSWIAPAAQKIEEVTMSGIRYIDLLKAAYDAIKAVDSDILVITGGLAPTGFNDFRNAIDDQVFLSALLDQGVTELSDAIGIQPDGFANPPDSTCCDQTPGVDSHFDNPRFYFLDTLNAYRAILVQKKASDVPLWITRFGWGTSDGNAIEQPNPQVNPFMNYTSPAEQAAYIPRAFELGKELGYIGSMFLYNLNGCQAEDGEACYYSLVNSANAARPVFTALQNQSSISTQSAEEVSTDAQIEAESTEEAAIEPEIDAESTQETILQPEEPVESLATEEAES